MKDAEDEAFDDLAKKQGSWGGGFPAKRKMAADKLHWSDCAVHNGPAYPAGKCDCGAMNDRQRLEAIVSVINKYLPPFGMHIMDAMDAIISLVDPLPAQEPYDQAALELCNVCGWKTLIPDDGCLNCERAQPAQDVDYWIREATAARQAEMAMRRELDAQPVQREWVGLTDEEIKGLWESRVSWTNNNFARAVEQLLKEKNA